MTFFEFVDKHPLLTIVMMLLLAAFVADIVDTAIVGGRCP
jgi:hypothetical protein